VLASAWLLVITTSCSTHGREAEGEMSHAEGAKHVGVALRRSNPSLQEQKSHSLPPSPMRKASVPLNDLILSFLFWFLFVF
jgi:hypothetical protein